MKIIINKISNFLKLPIIEQFYFFECLLLNISAKIIIKLIPTKYSYPLMGKQGKEIPNTYLNDKQNKQILLIRRTAKRVFREALWDTVCFDKALTIKWMLAFRRIPSTIYFGVSIDEQNKMKAHAWLKCNNIIISGKEGMNKFTVVSFFS